jgi:lysophospholipase L1-like esterase
LALGDGDRVVFLGNTLVEREQRSGWWEYALAASFPGKKVQFRNLGWSGDTVWGEARAGFDAPAEGFKRLREHTLALKPTVIVVGYGANESFAGPAGLGKFKTGLAGLLDALAPAKARLVLLSPLRQADLGRPLPDPAAHNKDLRLYADAIREEAKRRGAVFVDLYDLLGDIGKVRPAVTENGVHLTAAGYRWSAGKLVRALGLPPPDEPLTARKKRSFTYQEEKLPLGPATLVVANLPAGKHTLYIDHKPVVTADAKAWSRGVKYDRGPDFEQAQQLRKLIVAKNQLYFYRWRPQNVTYLFGFRRYEQGRNAREIPQFDPLVAAKEKEIAALSVPKPHHYEIQPAK